MSEALKTQDPLDRLLDELEVKAEQQHPQKNEAYWSCLRRHPRRPFRVACQVHFLTKDKPPIASLKGRTRNISRGGIGLLVRRPFITGEPLEVEAVLPDRRMYFAGLVAFCRYAGSGYYECGVAMKAAQEVPVFCEDLETAMKIYEWLRPQHKPA